MDKFCSGEKLKHLLCVSHTAVWSQKGLSDVEWGYGWGLAGRPQSLCWCPPALLLLHHTNPGKFKNPFSSCPSLMLWLSPKQPGLGSQCEEGSLSSPPSSSPPQYHPPFLCSSKTNLSSSYPQGPALVFFSLRDIQVLNNKVDCDPLLQAGPPGGVLAAEWE